MSMSMRRMGKKETPLSAIQETSLPLPLHSRGKVRDTYDLGNRLLMIATDRISAFDVVLPNPIPDKGAVLNLLSAFWFQKTAHLIPNHVVAVVERPETLKAHLKEVPGYLLKRSMIVRKATPVPVECVVRGYLSGSAWQEYQETGKVSGNLLPRGLRQADRLPEILFTPTTKAVTGHDLPVGWPEMERLVGKEIARELKEKSLLLYDFARDHALKRGIIIADTKFEFGSLDGRLILIDELFTPDSSRFWDERQYSPDSSPPSFDKQPVRDWLVSAGWNKEPPVPELPPEVIEATTQRYRQAYTRLTGKKWG